MSRLVTALCQPSIVTCSPLLGGISFVSTCGTWWIGQWTNAYSIVTRYSRWVLVSEALILMLSNEDQYGVYRPHSPTCQVSVVTTYPPSNQLFSSDIVNLLTTMFANGSLTPPQSSGNSVLSNNYVSLSFLVPREGWGSGMLLHCASYVTIFFFPFPFNIWWIIHSYNWSNHLHDTYSLVSSSSSTRCWSIWQRRENKFVCKPCPRNKFSLLLAFACCLQRCNIYGKLIYIYIYIEETYIIVF